MNPSTEIMGAVQGDTKGADIVPPSLDRAPEFARHSKADSTLRGYRADWRDFCAWCERNNQRALPATPEAVAAYIAECAGRLKVGSIQRRLNAIAEAHKAPEYSEGHQADSRDGGRAEGSGFDGGCSRDGGRHRLGTDWRRDRAIMLLGFAGAFRRAEMVGLDVPDLAFGRDGLTVTLRTSKTDQEVAGRKIEIPYGSNPETCPVRTVQTWLETAGIAEGPLFRSINRHGRLLAGG